MPDTEISGVVELGQWSTVPGGFEILLEPTSKLRRFNVRVRPRPERKSKVKHRRHRGRFLTEGPESGIG